MKKTLLIARVGESFSLTRPFHRTLPVMVREGTAIPSSKARFHEAISTPDIDGRACVTRSARRASKLSWRVFAGLDLNLFIQSEALANELLDILFDHLSADDPSLFGDHRALFYQRRGFEQDVKG